jgi:outer membrane murein-binding lipoprotein Lpp
MKKLFILFLILIFSALVWTLPAFAADTEIEQLKKQVQELMNRIDELEKKQTQTETKISEAKTEAEKSDKKSLQAGYDKGFFIKTPDENFTLKTNVQIQFRYTYLDFDRKVNTNSENWSNFYMRRARLFFTGNAPNKDWTYYLHIQLEPQIGASATSGVNLNDAYVTWKKYPYAQVQFGRAKIPYGLAFLQSATMLNGVERSFFSGETDVDGKEDTRKWPGGNANFQVSTEDATTKYPVGGLNLFRSQGIQMQGDINLFNKDSFLQYWAGVYNGRNTKGTVNVDSSLLWVGKISINPLGKTNLSQQGDLDYSKDPKISFLVSGARYTDRLAQYRGTADAGPDGYGDAVSAIYDIVGTDYDLAALFRYRGFSLDTEYAHENFKQNRNNGYEWDRFGYHFNAGYFIVPKKLEVVSRYAYVERVKDNDRTKSLTSGLGLVSVDGGTFNAVEDDLMEYSAGINYYFDGHRLKFSTDYSYLVRELSPAVAGAGSISDQHDNRIRTMFQLFY